MSERRPTSPAFRGFALAACLFLIAGCQGGEDDAATPGESPDGVIQVPAAPAGLVAVAGSAQVALNWSASPGATSYDIKRSGASGGPYTQLATASATSYADSAVTSGATYYYVVAAVNSAGAGANSIQTDATIASASSPPTSPAPPAAPSVPTNTAPTAPAGLATTPGNGQVSLTWSSSSGATSYRVKRGTASGGPYTQIASPAAPPYADGSLTNGITYYYTVSAANSAGESTNSNQASATPVAPVTVIRSIVINPAVAVVAPGGAVQFGGVLTGLTGSLVMWSIQETGNVGSVSSDGRYTAPSVAGTFHVVAKSSIDPSLTSIATVTVAAPAGTRPTLTPGVWKEITPPAPGFSGTFGAATMEVSPVNPDVIFVAIDTLGLWKSVDRGSNWRKVGVPATYSASTRRTSYLDSPVRVEVDPADGNHVIATQGVRGVALGFWESRDGGETWEMPQGFYDAAKNATVDVTSMAVDPTDFKHILLGSHSPWGATQNKAGVMETKDGGKTWILHQPVASWPNGSMGISFLYDPATGQGNSSTWLAATDGDGFWRTTNAGANWSRVSNVNIPHGGAQIYYAKNGTLYSGSTPYPVRSRDNGATWEQLQTGLSFFYYYSVYGDGDTLYTQLSYTGDNAGQGLQPYMSAPESTGGPWTPYLGGTQKFSNGPFMMSYDSANGIMYSANWRGGVWALKVIKP